LKLSSGQPYSGAKAPAHPLLGKAPQDQIVDGVSANGDVAFLLQKLLGAEREARKTEIGILRKDVNSQQNVLNEVTMHLIGLKTEQKDEKDRKEFDTQQKVEVHDQQVKIEERVAALEKQLCTGGSPDPREKQRVADLEAHVGELRWGIAAQWKQQDEQADALRRGLADLRKNLDTPQLTSADNQSEPLGLGSLLEATTNLARLLDMECEARCEGLAELGARCSQQISQVADGLTSVAERNIERNGGFREVFQAASRRADEKYTQSACKMAEFCDEVARRMEEVTARMEHLESNGQKDPEVSPLLLPECGLQGSFGVDDACADARSYSRASSPSGGSHSGCPSESGRSFLIVVNAEAEMTEEVLKSGITSRRCSVDSAEADGASTASLDSLRDSRASALTSSTGRPDSLRDSLRDSAFSASSCSPDRVCDSSNSGISPSMCGPKRGGRSHGHTIGVYDRPPEMPKDHEPPFAALLEGVVV